MKKCLIIFILCAFSIVTKAEYNTNIDIEQFLQIIGRPILLENINKRDFSGNKNGIWVGWDERQNSTLWLSIGHFKDGKRDGFFTAVTIDKKTKSYHLDSFSIAKNGLVNEIYLFYDNQYMLVIDNVHPITKKDYPSIFEAIKELQSFSQEYVLFYSKFYTNGIMEEEGWNISRLEKDGSFDCESDEVIEYGEYKYYDNKGCLVKQTDKTEQGLKELKERLHNLLNSDSDTDE